MTPYQTPHPQHTPRYGQQTPSHLPPPSGPPPHMNGPFLHPAGAATPGQRTPSYHPSPQSRSSYAGSDHGRGYNECKFIFYT